VWTAGPSPTCCRRSNCDDAYHGRTGPLPVRQRTDAELTPALLGFIHAAGAHGFERVHDFNGAEQNGADAHPITIVGGIRNALAPVVNDLNTYIATTHFNGQSTVVLDGDRATGESYCLAHHLAVDQDGKRTLMVAAIRYLDTFVKQDGAWLFAERRLLVDWTDTRPSAA
jgi:choline dehydrogenase-like flavoprotein